MKRFLLTLPLVFGAPLALSQPSELADEAFYRHAASCVALLKLDALALQPAAQGGDAQAKAEMVQLTAWGFGFIATAYKRGLRNPRADQMLAAAEAEQADWPRTQRQERGKVCRADARTIFAEASSLERAVVNNRAAARVERQLKPR